MKFNKEEQQIVELGQQIADLLGRYGNPHQTVLITQSEIKITQDSWCVPVNTEIAKGD